MLCLWAYITSFTARYLQFSLVFTCHIIGAGEKPNPEIFSSKMTIHALIGMDPLKRVSYAVILLWSYHFEHVILESLVNINTYITEVRKVNDCHRELWKWV